MSRTMCLGLCDINGFLIKLHQPIQIRSDLLLHILNLIVLPAKHGTSCNTKSSRKLGKVKAKRLSVNRNPLAQGFASFKRHISKKLNDLRNMPN